MKNYRANSRWVASPWHIFWSPVRSAFSKMLAAVWTFVLFAMVGATAIAGAKVESSDQDALAHPDVLAVKRPRLRQGVA